MDDSSPLANLLNEYLDAWNSKNTKDIASFFDKNGLYVDVALKHEVPVVYLEEYIQGYFSVGELHFNPIGVFTWGGNTVAYQEHTTGKSITGHDIDITTGEFIEFKNNKIITHKTYYSFPVNLSEIHKESYKAVESRYYSKYEKSHLKTVELDKYKNKLIAVMMEEKLYLQNNLSLVSLAKRMKISTHHLSQLINSQFGVSFFEFIYRFRIDDAKALLNNPDMSHVSVSDIWDNLGFNSASTFHAAFKRQVGISPLQYRKQHGNYSPAD